MALELFASFFLFLMARSSPWIPLAPVLGVALAALLACVALTPLPLWSECGPPQWRRSDNPDARGTSWVPYAWRVAAVETAVQVYWAAVLVWTRSAWLALHFGLWFPALAVVEWVKRRTADRACHTLGNGVSGHFFYFAWALTTARVVPRTLGLSRNALTGVLGAAFAVQGALTWWFGYHSLRQCALGAVAGFAWAAVSAAASRVLAEWAFGARTHEEESGLAEQSRGA